MTKRQRNKIYNKALESLPNTKFDEINFDFYSICRAISNGSYKVLGETRSMDLMEEMSMFKPHKFIQSGYFKYWLPKTDLLTRQIILDFCIEMTKD